MRQDCMTRYRRLCQLAIGMAMILGGAGSAHATAGGFGGLILTETETCELSMCYGLATMLADAHGQSPLGRYFSAAFTACFMHGLFEAQCTHAANE